MDPTEDLSARVLLKHILSTEPPRTPVTRRTSTSQSAGSVRRSSRLTNKDAGAQTPQSILRRSLRSKLRESITRKSLPSTKRRTASVAPRKSTPASASVLFDDGDTPRHILMNILRTEPVRSPVLHKKAMEAEEPQPPSANSSITSKRPSIELSAFDLPDITIGNAASIAKGLSRKRPHRSLNVTAFEKRLKEGDDVNVESDDSMREHSSLSLSSSTSLSLKTPFVDAQTERRGLQRRVSNRRKITEEEFGAAVKKRQTGGVSSFVEQGPSETVLSEGFTLGLSKFIEPDITADIVHSNTALYAQTDVTASSFSIVATQDKPTVMASQIQRQMTEAEHEELMEMDQKKAAMDGTVCLFPTEEAGPQIEECFSMSQSKDDLDAPQKEERKSTADGLAEEVEGTFDIPTSVREDKTTSNGDENRVEAEKEEFVVEVEGDFQPEEAAATFQSKEDEPTLDSQNEEVVPQENDGEYESNQENPEGPLHDSRAEDGDDDDDDDDDVLEEEDEEQTSERVTEHISRRAHCSEGRLLALAEAGGDSTGCTEMGLSDGKSKVHSTFDVQSSRDFGDNESGQPHSEVADVAESLAPEPPDPSPTEAEDDKENSFHLSYEDSGRLSNESPEEAAAEEPVQQPDESEEETDSEEVEEVPSKTPAFVREKRIFYQPDRLASPSVLKNVQASGSIESAPAPKPKQVRKRMNKREEGLPKSYLMSVFKHFAKTKVSADVYPVLKEIMDKYFQRMAEDLETFAAHAKRKTLEVEDAELLLKRQGYVTDKVPVEVLIEKYLRMDQRRLLIPIATSGNVVIPKKR